MKSEEWVVEVDQQDNLVGEVSREIAHDPTDQRLHREVMVLLYTNRHQTSFLLQRRSLNKKQMPGRWTLSVTGHVEFVDISGNDPDGYLTAAARETKEEIAVEAKNLKLVKKIEQHIRENWAMMGVVTGEYEGELSIDLEEVSEVKVFTKETVVGVSDKLTPGAKTCLEYLGLLGSKEKI